MSVKRWYSRKNKNEIITRKVLLEPVYPFNSLFIWMTPQHFELHNAHVWTINILVCMYVQKNLTFSLKKFVKICFYGIVLDYIGIYM